MSDLDALVDFATELRLGAGLGQAGVARAHAAIEAAGLRWRADGSVPLPDALIVVAFYPDVEATSYLDGDTEAEQIREAARQLSEALLNALAG